MLELDSDRRRVAEVISKQDRIFDRLGQLEYTLGLQDSKPKVFEDIENTMAEMKAEIATNKNEAEFRVTCCDQKLETLERDVKEACTNMKALESLNHMRDTETKRANETIEQMKFDQSAQLTKMSTTISNFEFRISNQLSLFETSLKTSQEQVAEFDAMIREMNQFIKQTYETSTSNKIAISRLSDMKIESKEFYETRD